jgi:protoporphyrinogen oxidase
MGKIAIIGAGISGLSMAQLLKDRYEVKLFEKEGTPGGLIRCKRIDGNLFHICGGHVFNSKFQDVLDWFWKFFDRDNEFTLTDRNSVVFMKDGKHIPYPIENHVYMMDENIQMNFIKDLLQISKEGAKGEEASDFEDFLQHRFGMTLYNLYFKPYNMKVWRRSLSTVPLKWLKGKLPMPTVEEMIFNNFNHIEEKKFVHSRFYYEKKGGSQFIVDRFSEGLDIECNADIDQITKDGDKWVVNGQRFDKVVYCGNIKQLPTLLKDQDLKGYSEEIDKLESHGTTAVFCQIDKNPYSWIYQPSDLHESHRIICTGNFSATNNANPDLTTGTVEFTDYISKEDILDNLQRIPLHPKYIAHHYSKYTYPIQSSDTRTMVQNLKGELAKDDFYMTGRFADWEYYNMDAAIKASMNTNDRIK